MSSTSPESPPPLARVLIVDDEEIVLVALRETLRQQGYEVDTAPNAVKGLEALHRHSYAVVITDQQMPLLTGLELLAQVKKQHPDTTRILITAVMNLTTVIDAINKAEIYRFLLKPWHRDELLSAVRGGIERYHYLAGARARLKAALTDNERLSRDVQALEKELKESQKRPMTKRM